MKEFVKIGNKKIGNEHPTYIIAEIGANHNKNKKTAKKLIDKAADANVDAVKFQTYKAERMYSKKTPKFGKDQEKPFDLIKSIELPNNWHKELMDYANDRGLDFFSSPFDFKAVDELEKINVPLYKIASFEIVDLELIKHVAEKQKPMILSTGMASLGEIEDAVKTIQSTGNQNIILLQCTSLYPATPELINLKAIQTMKQSFGLPVGLSDHTLGIHIPIAAVAMGACIIEKHFTLDRNMAGPDHHFAIEPEELKTMIKWIRDVEKAKGDGIKKISKQEKEENYEKARRSIIAKKRLSKGTTISRDMLIVKRPGYGIKPKFMNLVLGRKTKKDIEEDEWITWDKI